MADTERRTAEMDAKEIKNKLKNAREAIRKKEFKEALKQCKGVLSEAGDHYMALVLVGVAAEGLEQHDQAMKAYRRAITADDTQLLAWQGLGGYYEKNPSPEHTLDQIDVYMKLVELYSGDPAKKTETVGKLAAMVAQCELDKDRADKVADILTDNMKDVSDKDAKVDLQKALLAVVRAGSRKDTEDQVLQLSDKVLKNVTDHNPGTETTIADFLALLAKRGDSSLVSTCTDLHTRFPASPAATEWTVICHLDRNMGEEKPECGEEFTELIGSLQAVCDGEDQENPALLAASGYQRLCDRNWIAARDLFSQALSKCPRLVCVYAYHSLVLLARHQNEEALKTAQKGFKALQKKDRQLTIPASQATASLHLLQVQALVELGDPASLNVAMETLTNELDSSSEKVQVLKGQLHLRLGEVEQAKACVVGDSAQTRALEGQIANKEGDLTLAVSKYESAVEIEPDRASHAVALATCLWKLPDRRKECFTTLLKAAKLDPYASPTFLYLGRYYHEEAGDRARARRCYQKSYDLDPRSDPAGEALCDLLNEDGEEDSAHKILVDVTSRASAGSGKWAWLRLGLYQVKHEDPSVAVASFQSALRSDPSDNHVWECLGEAYLARGSYTASLKAFTRASELEPESLYALFQMAAIKQTLGSYREAIDEYKLILNKSTNYVPALKGLGETYLLVAKTLLSRYFHGCARDMAEMGLSCLFRAATHRPDLSCLWKLLGDACTILHVLPAEGFRFEKPDKTVLNKMETLELGGRCYVKALKLLPECSSLWHDLGLSYLHQSECSTDGDAAISLVGKAEQALKKAIQLEPTNHRHWTALGFVACAKECFKPALAQHCFIKSIQAESNNVVAWTNLAALYLKHDNIKLAHEAFKVAQSLEPSYVSCWVGQAVIAEMVGHDEAMDLFRHTTELGNHVESALGYGHWVCSMLQNREAQHSPLYVYCIERMAAIPAASDVLARYTDRVKTNAVAYNLHGLLLERQGLYTTAAAQLQRAVEILEKTGGNDAELQLVLCNYARLLCKAGQHPASVSVFERVANIARFEDVCHMALALYKAGNLDSSYQVYSKALELAETEADRSHVLTAIAMVWYKFGNKDKAKTTLFQSSQMSESSPAGLKALCALGVTQGDVTLATAALQELLKLPTDSVHSADVSQLTVALHVLQGDLTAAGRYLQRLILRSPDHTHLWRHLAEVLLRHMPERGRAIAGSASRALELEKLSGKQIQDLTIVAMGQLSAGYHEATLSPSKALYTAQKAVHLYPGRVETWCCLVSALHAEAVMAADRQRRRGLLQQQYKLIGHILSDGDLSLELRLWCYKQRVVCCLHGNKQSEAVESLEAILTDCGTMPEAKQYFELFRLTMQEDAKSLLALAEAQGTAYIWQIVVDLYLKAGLLEEVKAVISKVGQSCSGARYIALVKLAHVLLERIMARGPGWGELQGVFEDTLSQALAESPCSTVVALMQAILRFTGNPKMARHKLRGVLECGGSDARGHHEVTLARQALIFLLQDDPKHTELLQTVIEEARQDGDSATVCYYDSLQQIND